jgi:hypothetical protein
MSDLITVTHSGKSMLDPNTFKVTKHIEADLHNEEIQDVVSTYGWDKAHEMIGKQMYEQIKNLTPE